MGMLSIIIKMFKYYISIKFNFTRLRHQPCYLAAISISLYQEMSISFNVGVLVIWSYAAIFYIQIK